MKKLKRTDSTGVNKVSRKALSQNKNNSINNFKNKPKKTVKAAFDKQNILIEEPESKYAKVKVNFKKKISEKKNKRSKSLIYQRKVVPRIDTTTNSSRLIQQLGYLKSQEKKSPMNIPENFGSVRAQTNQDLSSFVDYSPLFMKNKNDHEALTQPQQILIEDVSIQCEHFEIEEDQTALAEKLDNEKEKEQLKSKIQDLQAKMKEVLKESSIRQAKIHANHDEQTQELTQSILNLKDENLTLTKQKKELKSTIQSQQKEITNYRQVQISLQNRLKSEETIKLNLLQQNEESKKQIQFYKNQLASFEESLTDLQKMKKVYEKRLDQLEQEKVRIKKNACQLLNMVEKYKQIEEKQ